jgi:hypothetical protein
MPYQFDQVALRLFLECLDAHALLNFSFVSGLRKFLAGIRLLNNTDKCYYTTCALDAKQLTTPISTSSPPIPGSILN